MLHITFIWSRGFASASVEPEDVYRDASVKWDWTSDMKAESIAPVLKSWSEVPEGSSEGSPEGSLEAIVWDGAKGHHGAEYDEVEACRIQQPPYSPELQPAERVFEYLRARIEGVVHGALDAKKEAVERELRTLASCPEKVRSLTYWDWIEKALTQLAGK